MTSMQKETAFQYALEIQRLRCDVAKPAPTAEDIVKTAKTIFEGALAMSTVASEGTESPDQVVGLSREICKLCYHVNPVGFRVPEEIRNAVTPEHIRGKVICLSCFARLADEKCIAWDREIEFFPVSLATHLSG